MDGAAGQRAAPYSVVPLSFAGFRPHLRDTDMSDQQQLQPSSVPPVPLAPVPRPPAPPAPVPLPPAPPAVGAGPAAPWWNAACAITLAVFAAAGAVVRLVMGVVKLGDMSLVERIGRAGAGAQDAADLESLRRRLPLEHLITSAGLVAGAAFLITYVVWRVKLRDSGARTNVVQSMPVRVWRVSYIVLIVLTCLSYQSVNSVSDLTQAERYAAILSFLGAAFYLANVWIAYQLWKIAELTLTGRMPSAPVPSALGNTEWDGDY